MGCFPCFDSKEEEKLNPEPVKYGGRREKNHLSVPSNLSRLSSGADRKLRNNTSSRRDVISPRDAPEGQISAHIFTFRELAAATNNFRSESFLGEGGFGRVYRGRLESTGQVHVSL
ncbi:hypothetical protein QQ045_015792 [Rhodiola kirilowii]